MAETLHRRVLAYIRRYDLMRAGDRVGIAVSGGADSVALLRLLLELRTELGVVLSVVHFNHKIRGADADADEAFVQTLAERHRLEFHCSSGDAPAHAREQRLSLETAAGKLRYEFFRSLLSAGQVDKVATAHTLNDQAETVLMRLVRGAWNKGLAGIHPEWQVASELRTNARSLDSTRQKHARSARDDKQMQVPRSARDDNSYVGSIVRPLLEIRRPELEEYLRALGQEWREDATNRDLEHLRNRVRHMLLPLLEKEFNPAIRERLADMAEISRAEEDLFWGDEVHAAYEAVKPHWVVLKEPVASSARENPVPGLDVEAHLSVARLKAQPVALRRRVIRVVAEELELSLSFRQVDQCLTLLSSENGSEVELSRWWIARRVGRCPRPEPTAGRSAAADPELVFCRRAEPQRDYDYALRIPGEAAIPEIGLTLRASVIPLKGGEKTGYNRGELLDVHLLGAELRVRNWRSGDRFWPAHSKSEKKVKELLQERHVSGPQRALWPVVVQGNELLWMQGFGVAEKFAPGPDAAEGVVIEVAKA